MKLVSRLAALVLLLVLLIGPRQSRVESRPDLWKTLTSGLGSSSANDNNNGASDGPTCGYKSCPKTDQNKLNVHIIAHTHDDVGWLKTVDQYFYGTRKGDSQASVQYILDSVIPQLLMDKTKRFIYVEMSFFVKWWDEQEEPMRETVRQLVNEGRLEFINGGWCMNDEATVNYHSTIEQMTLGLKFLNETFGPCGRPKVGWQIDPFGHTNEQASLFAQFGFDGMFFTRINYLDKLHRTQNKSLDLVWHGDRALPGQSGSIFTNIFRDGYDAPNGFCFDALCKDDVVVDSKRSYEYNVDRIGNYIIEFLREYSKAKLTNHLLVPFGGDFQFSAAGQNFKSLDKLLKYVRLHAPDINIFYSTPSCYQYAIYETLQTADATNQQVNSLLPEKFNDFMPYDSSATVWWSGFFTSRPSVKLIERSVANLLQVSRLVSLSTLLRSGKQQQQQQQLFDWVKHVEEHEAKCLRPLWEILGDLQHHDAVTGTEKQHVADDYVRRAVDAANLCVKFIGDQKRRQLDELLEKSSQFEQVKKAGKKFHLNSIYLEETMFCPLLNISQCDALESDVDVRRYSLNQTGAQKQQHLGRTEIKSSLSNSKQERLPSELLTKSVLITAYNPLNRPANNVDVRLPCNGRCDLEKVQVIHLGTNETLRLVRLPVPAGVGSLPFRDAHTTYELLFYISSVPPLGSISLLISDENKDEIVDEELSLDDSILITDSTASRERQPVTRSRRVRQVLPASARYAYFTMKEFARDGVSNVRKTREAQSTTTSAESTPTPTTTTTSNRGLSDQVVVKFDMNSGVIVGLRRVSDGSFLNITQKFGYYFPADYGHQPGAYIFRPNSSEPHLFTKPISFRMFKRQGGALIEIHQKWADWIWQTIRVDAKKNYIEFDYVVGPIPETGGEGREIVTRYITNMANEGVFLTDSNARQLLPRRRRKSELVTELGGSFYPIVSTLMIRNNRAQGRSNKSAEAVAILVDRGQAGTSLNEGDLELLVHRRQLADDNFGVGEALNEPGEDGRGLVTRGRHRLFLKFQDQAEDLANVNKLRDATNKSRGPILVKLDPTPRENLKYEQKFAEIYRNESIKSPLGSTYLVNDQLLDDLRQESIKYALKPIFTFDRLRVGTSELLQMLPHTVPIPISDVSLLNSSLPNNIHLLTLQPWNRKANQLLIRLENLDNPLTLHPLPDQAGYNSLLRAYKSVGREINQTNQDDACLSERLTQTEVDITYLIKGVRITDIDEQNLGANNCLADDKRLNWTNEQIKSCSSSNQAYSTTSIKLGPRQIRTFLVDFEFL